MNNYHNAIGIFTEEGTGIVADVRFSMYNAMEHDRQQCEGCTDDTNMDQPIYSSQTHRRGFPGINMDTCQECMELLNRDPNWDMINPNRISGSAHDWPSISPRLEVWPR